MYSFIHLFIYSFIHLFIRLAGNDAYRWFIKIPIIFNIITSRNLGSKLFAIILKKKTGCGILVYSQRIGPCNTLFEYYLTMFNLIR